MPKAEVVLPRPGLDKLDILPQTISAPSEAAFIQTFGQLLPPASYLHTPNGNVAYYELPASAQPSSDNSTTPSRVLFVHGVQTPAIGLQPLASTLSQRFPHAQCILVDLWGHGLTDTPIVAHEPALFHSLIEALMVHLKWKDAHLIGYSFGGSTTATFAAANPERVASMVLVAPAGLMKAAQFKDEQRSYLRGGEGLEDKARDWILEFLEGGPLVVPTDWKDRVARGEVVAEAVRDWQMQQHDGHVSSVVGIFRDGGVLDKHTGFAEAAKKDIKCLSILGELDEVCTEEDLRGVGLENVVVVPQVGHGVVRQRVPEVAGFIEEFWSQL